MASNGSRGKAQSPRPIGAAKLGEVMAQGGEIRRGTRLKSALPQWEFQAFNRAGEFVAPIDWRIVARLPWQVSDNKGINR